MTNNYLLDTNVLIYYFSGVVSGDNFEIDRIFEESFNISIISKIEFLGWAGFKNDEVLYRKAVDFVGNASIFSLNDDVADEAIRMRQARSIKIPDAVIAATAKINSLTLMTNDTDGFKKPGYRSSAS